MSKMPGFNAVSSLSRPTRSYRTRASGIPSAIYPSVVPQQLGAIGGVGGLGGLGLLELSLYHLLVASASGHALQSNASLLGKGVAARNALMRAKASLA